MMRGYFAIGLAAAALAVALPAAGDPVLAPTGVLRATYIASNPAQATRDPATGEIRGVAADITRELGRRANMPVVIVPAQSAAEVLEAVRLGTADIGFVAPNPDRVGVVLYSQTYMLVQQSAVVRDSSSISSVAELDQPGRTIGVNTGDSVGVWLRSRLRHARLIETPDYSLKQAVAWLADGTVDAFAGNRQRLGIGIKNSADLRILPDNLYGVPQTVAVALERGSSLKSINIALNEMRNSGLLERSVVGSGVLGISVAPAAD